MQNPAIPLKPAEKPQTNWPKITVGSQMLIVRWTFYTQFLLSKRGVDVRKMPTLAKELDPGLVSVMVECFAAAVAQNYKDQQMPIPDADHWAMAIEEISGEDPGVWKRVCSSIWEAINASVPKTEPAAAPATEPVATEPAKTTLTQ